MTAGRARARLSPWQLSCPSPRAGFSPCLTSTMVSVTGRSAALADENAASRPSPTPSPICSGDKARENTFITLPIDLILGDPFLRRRGLRQFECAVRDIARPRRWRFRRAGILYRREREFDAVGVERYLAWCNSCVPASDLVPFPLRAAVKRGSAFD